MSTTSYPPAVQSDIVDVTLEDAIAVRIARAHELHYTAMDCRRMAFSISKGVQDATNLLNDRYRTVGIPVHLMPGILLGVRASRAWRAAARTLAGRPVVAHPEVDDRGVSFGHARCTRCDTRVSADYICDCYIAFDPRQYRRTDIPALSRSRPKALERRLAAGRANSESLP